jgi:fatty-acid desaturase
MLTFGEGWHNNHHASAQAARHGLAWYEVDVNWYGICVLRTLGLAWNIKQHKLRSRATQPGELRPAARTPEVLLPTIVAD